ncbi:MAG: hypothetical protein AAFY26_19515 [Cyanobacteria bacterium J06638_22]
MKVSQLRTKSQIAAACMYAIDAATGQTDGFFDLNFSGQQALIEYIESLNSDEQLALASDLLKHCQNFTGTLIISVPESEKPSLPKA